MIVPYDSEHLKKLIENHVIQYGYKCDLNHIDVSNITDFSYLFSYSEFNGDISQWDVSNAKNMEYMFFKSAFNGNISKWNVSNVKNTNKMFSYSQFKNDISNWNINDHCFCLDMFSKNNYPKDGTIFWLLVLIDDIKIIDKDKLEFLEKFTPILLGLDLSIITAAKFLNKAYHNENQDMTVINFMYD